MPHEQATKTYHRQPGLWILKLFVLRIFTRISIYTINIESCNRCWRYRPHTKWLDNSLNWLNHFEFMIQLSWLHDWFDLHSNQFLSGPRYTNSFGLADAKATMAKNAGRKTPIRKGNAYYTFITRNWSIRN